jgi:hypothetical protein
MVVVFLCQYYNIQKGNDMSRLSNWRANLGWISDEKLAQVRELADTLQVADRVYQALQVQQKPFTGRVLVDHGSFVSVQKYEITDDAEGANRLQEFLRDRLLSQQKRSIQALTELSKYTAFQTDASTKEVLQNTTAIHYLDIMNDQAKNQRINIHRGFTLEDGERFSMTSSDIAKALADARAKERVVDAFIDAELYNKVGADKPIKQEMRSLAKLPGLPNGDLVEIHDALKDAGLYDYQIRKTIDQLRRETRDFAAANGYSGEAFPNDRLMHILHQRTWREATAQTAYANVCKALVRDPNLVPAPATHAEAPEVPVEELVEHSPAVGAQNAAHHASIAGQIGAPASAVGIGPAMRDDAPAEQASNAADPNFPATFAWDAGTFNRVVPATTGS